jgi:NDP-mannose synthase
VVEETMKALILAGGKGTRLRPYTTVIPKPLMPVGNMAILELLLLQLKKSSVTEVIIAIGYLGHLIKAYFQERDNLGLDIQYYEEKSPLGTAGAIGGVISELTDDFLLLNGDLLTTLNFQELVESHCAQRAGITIGTYTRKIGIEFGVLESTKDNALINYIEKPTHSYDVSMGVYVINRKAVENIIELNKYLDMPNLVMKAKSAGHLVYCYKGDCFWLDIGRPSDYDEANKIFETDPSRFLS